MLNDLLTLNFKYSESHQVFPRIILTLVMFLGLIIVVKSLFKMVKEGKLKEMKFKFFVDNYDKVKFYGTLGLLIGYVLLLQVIGFLAASIVFIFLSTLLFMGNLKRKALITSAISALSTSLIVWFVFGYVFNITLP